MSRVESTLKQTDNPLIHNYNPIQCQKGFSKFKKSLFFWHYVFRALFFNSDLYSSLAQLIVSAILFIQALHTNHSWTQPEEVFWLRLASFWHRILLVLFNFSILLSFCLYIIWVNHFILLTLEFINSLSTNLINRTFLSNFYSSKQSVRYILMKIES